VHVKTCVPPTQYLFDKLWVYQLFVKKKQEDLTAEKPTEQGGIELRYFVELFFFICPSLCDQKMEVRMKEDESLSGF